MNLVLPYLEVFNEDVLRQVLQGHLEARQEAHREVHHQEDHQEHQEVHQGVHLEAPAARPEDQVTRHVMLSHSSY